jgi:hypothetical protein
VLVSPEPAGANCQVGGTRIEIGIDDDRDGVLDVPDEVDQTSFICTPPDPNFGQFLPTQTVRGATLTCASTAMGSGLTICDTPLLNGLEILDGLAEATVICATFDAVPFSSTSNSPASSQQVFWDGTRWTVGTASGVFISIACEL